VLGWWQCRKGNHDWTSWGLTRDKTKNARFCFRDCGVVQYKVRAMAGLKLVLTSKQFSDV
jgi:hypothetical protein